LVDERVKATNSQTTDDVRATAAIGYADLGIDFGSSVIRHLFVRGRSEENAGLAQVKLTKSSIVLVFFNRLKNQTI
jgi:hypothetical protein